MAFVMQNGARRGAIQISCKEEIPLAHCVRLWNGVRRRAREGKKKGGGRKSSVTRKPASAALLFPFLTPCAMHHSAADGRRWRNLLRLTAILHKTACYQPYRSKNFNNYGEAFMQTFPVVIRCGAGEAFVVSQGLGAGLPGSRRSSCCRHIR